MTDERRQTVRRVFMEVADLRGDEQETALAKACADDPLLRPEVELLLRADERAGGFMGAPTADAAPREAAATVVDGGSRERPGQMIGRYKLLEQLGEGGFGVVWAAEQREPVKRRVALKVIKLGMDTKQVIARFEAERQALAMMDHPNIAKVLDAGSTESGRPYFVMELVRGVPILEYCDTEKLDTRHRLELFIQVCNAIQHAHQKGIIHRDIKPSNVLVTLHDGRPVPKVIDFGIAKATNQELTEKTIYTQHRQMVGTPAYMSPEQAEMSGLDIDTRSDIYSLGVLLYELLTGSTPISNEELMSKGFAEMMRVIRDVEPQRPSTRLSTLGATATEAAARRKTASPQQLGVLLKGDLDWIVMKCLEKDRTRRYDTANGLSADIRRHLDDEPVLAGPPTAKYRLGKLVRRHRGVFVAMVAVFGVLVLGIVGTSIGLAAALRAKAAEAEQRRMTEQRFDLAQRYVGTISDEVYPGIRSLIGATQPLEALTRATSEFLDGLAVDSLDSPELRLMMVRALERLGDAQGNRYAANSEGDFQKSLKTLLRARELLATLPPDYPDPVTRFYVHFGVEDAVGSAQLEVDPKAALETYLALEEFCHQSADAEIEGAAETERSLSASTSKTRNLLNLRIGHVYGALGEYESQLERYEATARGRIASGIDPETAPFDDVHQLSVVYDLLSSAERNLGRLDEARGHIEQSLAVDRVKARRWPNHARAPRDLLDDLGKCAWLSATTGQFEGLGSLADETIQAGQALVVRDPSNTPSVLTYMGALLRCGDAFQIASAAATGRERIDRLNRAVELWSLAVDSEAALANPVVAARVADWLSEARANRESALRTIRELEADAGAGSGG